MNIKNYLKSTAIALPLIIGGVKSSATTAENMVKSAKNVRSTNVLSMMEQKSMDVRVALIDNYKKCTSDTIAPDAMNWNLGNSFKRVNVTPPKVGDVSQPFAAKSTVLMYKTPHKTKLLNVAQDHLGMQEVSEKEYLQLLPSERQNTQMHFIGKYGNVNHQWCAHTASHLSEKAGMDIGGHKAAVQEFINWAKANKTYRPINQHIATAKNYKEERIFREKQIEQQFKSMNEGDFIIWKSSYVAELPDGKVIPKKSSHIGILESYDKEKGTISVIEGNANEFKSDVSERELVKTAKEGIIGGQDVGDFKEVNRRDGVIRKVYTAKDLASFGYSGYIDNSKIMK